MNFYFLSALYVVLLFIPSELYLSLGGVRLEFYRLFLLVFFAACLPRIMSDKLRSYEKVLIAYCVWAFLSYVYRGGIGGVQSGVILAMEVFGSYCLGKYCVYQFHGNYIKLVRFVCYGLAILLPFAIVETSNGVRIFHILAADLVGGETRETLGDSYIRYGLYRASTVFKHPILFGVIGGWLGLVAFLTAKGPIRYFFLIVMLGCVICSVTSAAILMIIFAVIVIAVEYVSKKFSYFRKLMLYSLLSVLLFVQVFSNQGVIQFVVLNISLNPWTAFARYLQWYFAWDDVMRYWAFGGGIETWSRPFWMSSSVDSYWLKVALNNGLVASVILAVSWILIIRRTHSVYMVYLDPVIKYTYCVLIGVTFASITVDFFDRAQPIAYLMLGLAVGYMDQLDNYYRSIKAGKNTLR
jgi:hypothetical protein